MSQKNSLDAKAIGARFRSARSLVPHLNRKSFCERHGLNRYTMQSWENGLHVSKGKNVEKFIEALAKEGIACSAEWLFEGVGDPARPYSQESNVKTPESSTQDQLLQKKLNDPSLKALEQFFRDKGLEFKTFLIPDDAMSPKFRKGDVVVGLSHDLSQPIESNKFFVVELSEERSLVRRMHQLKDQIILSALDESAPIINASNPNAIFEIVWHML